MAPKSAKRASSSIAPPKKGGRGGPPFSGGADDADGGAGDAADQPRDPRLEGIKLSDLPGSAIASRSEEQLVFQLLSESFQSITEVFVHYAKHWDHHTIFAATRLSYGK